jgi:hypothetical protein
MGNERRKMLAGELYDPMDPELVAGRERARDLCKALNATREAEHEERRRILRAVRRGLLRLRHQHPPGRAWFNSGRLLTRQQSRLCSFVRFIRMRPAHRACLIWSR